jgi:hypothetical protein
MLELSAPVCVNGGDDDPASGVTRMQIDFDGQVYPASLVGKHVQITGKLWHSETAYQHTDVLITVSKDWIR